ncbi:FIST signal transduction protein [Catellatospora tritici]|uniref:FIST signal transduction protein n=1 Tax=Catellatospora tritici TaxID=2851566 RepID=UPI001C2DC2AC|nr:FIST N-terminal domain-containing protein [Catellatospora tritici]MBV1856588.1 FIST C-terminal domain-containing protein [Catellatospora tritici]
MQESDTASPARRWMGVGRSTLTDSRAAATAAAHAAQTGADTKLLIVFAAINHEAPAVLAGLAEAAPGVTVIGCTTHGEIGPGGPADGTITVAALGGPGFQVETCVATGVAGRQGDAGYEVADCVGRVDLPHKVLMLLTDGLVRDQESIVRGCYRALGAGVPLFGGAAADGWRMSGAYLFHDGEVLTDAVVGAAIASEAPLAVGVRHGYQTVGQPMMVTRTENGRVLSLDDRPALDVYLERLGAPPEVYTDPAAFTAFALPRPLGVQRRSGVEARNLSTEVDLEGRSIGGGGAIDPGGLTWVMTGDEQSILEATDAACVDALGRLGGHEPIGMLTLSCAALRAALGDEGIRREGERLQKWAGSLPYAGFYTYGEIARNHGIDGFHNQTLVVLALS